jgi:hypothetical protein
MNNLLQMLGASKNGLVAVLLMLWCSSSIAFAKTGADTKTLLTVKLYSEPHNKDMKLSYILTLPRNHYYSLYQGSDLPAWRYVEDRIAQGEFHSVSLVTIRIHPDRAENKLAHKNNARLTVIDPENARVVWQGELQYDVKHAVKVKADINNQKYYDTVLRVDQASDTVWLETTGR